MVSTTCLLHTKHINLLVEIENWEKAKPHSLSPRFQDQGQKFTCYVA